MYRHTRARAPLKHVSALILAYNRNMAERLLLEATGADTLADRAAMLLPSAMLFNNQSLSLLLFVQRPQNCTRNRYDAYLLLSQRAIGPGICLHYSHSISRS